MSTLGQAFAALVMRLSERLSLQPSDFLAFPSFQTRLSLEQVESVSNPEQSDPMDAAATRRRLMSIEGFSRLVNYVPTGKRDFVLTGQPLWTIYQQVLQEAETAARPAAEADQAALEFQRRKETLTINERRSVSGDAASYWPVGVNPVVNFRDAQSWTRITLDQKAIEETARRIPKDLEEWLKARDLMRELGAASVRGVTIEACHLSIRRSWFDQTVFKATNWRFRDTSVLSDGGRPPVGLLPAVVQGVVLIRKLELELEPASGAEQVTAETQGGDQPEAAPKTLLLKRAFVLAAPLSLKSLVEPPKAVQTGTSGRIITPAEAATSGFPSPAIIKAQPVIERLDKNMAGARLELEKVAQQLATNRQELSKEETRAKRLQDTLSRFPANVDQVVERDHRRPRTGAAKGRRPPATNTGDNSTTVTLDLKAMRVQLAAHTQRIGMLKAAIMKTEATQRRLNEKLNKWRDEKVGYEALSVDPFGADEVFLFATVCSLTPKSPNPTPALF
jgi:hypothetical protein